jgi:HD-GYP domain-containing protein (c-di-GMP phosphodiesterase class II)
MRTDRSYRKALSHEVAMTELLAISGSQLDPRVVDALVRVVTPAAEAAAAREAALTAVAAPKPLAQTGGRAAPAATAVSGVTAAPAVTAGSLAS